MIQKKYAKSVNPSELSLYCLTTNEWREGVVYVNC